MKQKHIVLLGIFGLAIIVFPSHSARAQGRVLLSESLADWQFASGYYGDPVTDLTPNRTMIAGSFVSYLGGTVLTVGNEWNTWSGDYRGQVVWTGPKSPSALINVGMFQAFGFKVEPQSLAPERITVTLSDGTRLSQIIDGRSGAGFFGWTGDGIQWVRIDDDDGGSFAFGEMRANNRQPYASRMAGQINEAPFTAAITAADLVSNTFVEQIIGSHGPYQVPGVLIGTPQMATEFCYGINGAQTAGQCFYPGAIEQPDGTYNIPVDRTEIAPAVTYAIIPVDGDQPAPMLINFNLDQSWAMFGKVKHTVYNTPAESNCSGATQTGYVVNSECVYTAVTFPQSFVSQADLNGTGQSINFGLLGSSVVLNLPPSCSGVTPPPGSTPSNTFIQISSVMGECGYTLTANSVAVYPPPKTVTPGGMNAACGDNILVLKPNGDNKFNKSADDACAACKHGKNTFISHIDDYLGDDNSCFATGNYSGWSADTQGETQ